LERRRGKSKWSAMCRRGRKRKDKGRALLKNGVDFGGVGDGDALYLRAGGAEEIYCALRAAKRECVVDGKQGAARYLL